MWEPLLIWYLVLKNIFSYYKHIICSDQHECKKSAWYYGDEVWSGSLGKWYGWQAIHNVHMPRRLCRCRQEGSGSIWRVPTCFKAKIGLRVKDPEEDDTLMHNYAFCPLSAPNPTVFTHQHNHIISAIEMIVFTGHLSSIFDSGTHLKYSSLPHLPQ